MTTRRSFITGLISLVAAPAIVRAGSLMPVKMMIEPYGIGPAIVGLGLRRDYESFRAGILNEYISCNVTFKQLFDEVMAE